MTLQEQVGGVLTNASKWMAYRVRKTFALSGSGGTQLQPLPWFINNNNGPWVVDATYAMAVAHAAGFLAPSEIPVLTGAIQSLAHYHQGNQPATPIVWPKQINKARSTAWLVEAARLTQVLIPPETWAKALNAVAFEADRASVRYMRDEDGDLKSPGDSGSEEDGWIVMALGYALALLPIDARVPAWTAKFNEALAATYARPQDVVGEPILHGSNAEIDGLIWNHDILPHVKYQRMAFGAIALTARLYDVLRFPLGTWFRFAAPDVYPILTNRVFNGQTIYVPGTADIYFPAGDDSDVPGTRMTFAWTDAAAHRYGFDGGLGANFCELHTAYAAALQARFTDGHSFAPGEYTIGTSKDVIESALASHAAATYQLLVL